MHDVSESIIELNNFNNPYSISKIEWWLLKYKDLRKNIVLEKIGSCFHDLPCCCDFNDESNVAKNKLINYYDSLYELSEIHRLEPYLKDEMIYLESIKNDPSEMEEWVLKNEKIGSKLTSFVVNYLDYRKDAYHLKCFFYTDPQKDFFVDRKDFTNIIEFSIFFNSQFYKN
jgi:hypothetical protein